MCEKFQCKNWEGNRNLAIDKEEVKPKSSAFSDHLLLCNHSPSFTSLSVLTKENRIEKKYPNNER